MDRYYRGWIVNYAPGHKKAHARYARSDAPSYVLIADNTEQMMEYINAANLRIQWIINGKQCGGPPMPVVDSRFPFVCPITVGAPKTAAAVTSP